MPAKPPIAEPTPDPDYDPQSIFQPDGPFSPAFMREAVRTLMRSLPIEPDEPPSWTKRRMYSAMLSVAAMHPRDEIEVMLAVQAVAAYYAAASGWWLGMNHHRPNGDSTRHASMAASAVRTFDALLKALERRQAKPLAVPVGRPANRHWPREDYARVVDDWTERCQEQPAEEQRGGAQPKQNGTVVWSPQFLAVAAEQRAREKARVGVPDFADVEGILPDGGMIMPKHPTPQQEAYIAHRLGLAYRQEYEDNKRRGLTDKPKLRVLRAGDRVP